MVHLHKCFIFYFNIYKIIITLKIWLSLGGQPLEKMFTLRILCYITVPKLWFSRVCVCVCVYTPLLLHKLLLSLSLKNYRSYLNFLMAMIFCLLCFYAL